MVLVSWLLLPAFKSMLHCVITVGVLHTVFCDHYQLKSEFLQLVLLLDVRYNLLNLPIIPKFTTQSPF